METAGAKLKKFLAKSFAWTAETQRPQVVDGKGDVSPEEGDEGE